MIYVVCVITTCNYKGRRGNEGKNPAYNGSSASKIYEHIGQHLIFGTQILMNSRKNDLFSVEPSRQ